MGYNLKLSNEPSLLEIVEDVEGFFLNNSYREIVFCGYGEPTMRWEVVRDFSKMVKEGKIKNVKPDQRIRINTNGLGNLVNKRDITKEMRKIIDSVNISLNTTDPDQWLLIVRPFKEYEKDGFNSVIDFIMKVKEEVSDVVISAVDLREVNVEKVSEFAKKIGVKFKLRPLLDNENG